MLTKIKQFLAFPEKMNLIRTVWESLPILLPMILRGEEVDIVIEYEKKGGDNK